MSSLEEGSSDSDTSSESEGDKNTDSLNYEALLDVLKLYAAPGLYSIRRKCSSRFNSRWFEKREDPLAVAFVTSLLKLNDIDDAESLKHLQRVLIVPQLMSLLKECLSTQRWPEVVEVLRVLALEKNETSLTLWKAGFEAMMSDQAGSSGLMLQLFHQLKNLCDIEAEEVTLEYIKYLMCQGRIEDTVQVFEGAKVTTTRIATIRKEESSTELKAYQGLCWYVEWLRAKHKLESLGKQENEEDYFTTQSSALSKMAEEDLMKRHAEKAITAFASLKDATGLMDIFIMKYVELLEYYQEYDKAESVLTEYASKHPNNPNAWRYLYSFFKNQKPDSEKMIGALQSYVRSVPSDALALELYQLQQSKGELPGVLLPILLNMLDYPVWKDRLKPWQTLLALVTQIYSSHDCEGEASLQQCWRQRSSWWPKFYFSVDTLKYELKTDQSQELLCCKAALAVFLLGPDNQYSKYIANDVVESLPSIQESKRLFRSFAVT